MSKTTNEILTCFQEIEFLEDNIAKQKKLIKELSSQLISEDFYDMNYEELKKFYNFTYYLFSNEALKDKCKHIMEQKKIEKYPALKQATYYPIINTLDIPDEEKVKLDNIAYKCYRYTIRQERFSNFELTSDIIDIFVKLGIAKEEILFHCPRCGSPMDTFEKEKIDKYFRYWELKEKDTFTEEQEKEFEELCDDDDLCFGIISLSCYNCDSYAGDDIVEVEINDMGDYQKAMDNGDIESCYSFMVKPDLTYEKL